MFNFQNGYTPWYQQPQQQQQTNISVAFIQGGDFAANNYLVAPNQAVILIDNESGMLYMKTTDASGNVISNRKFKEEKPVPPQMQSDFVTRDEFEKRLQEFSNAKQSAATD